MVPEDTRVPFTPNGRTHKHSELNSSGGSHVDPPIFDAPSSCPNGSVDTLKMKPFIDQSPKSQSVSTFEEEVLNGFLLSLAKRARAIVWPSSLGQAVRRPKPILDGKPSKEFYFRRGPRFPNHLVHVGVSNGQELHVIRRGRGVIPIGSMLP